MNRKKTIAVLTITLFLLPAIIILHKPSHANVIEYKVKAAFIEKFTRFIEWPFGEGEGSSSPFIIGVVGETAIREYLNELAEKRKIKGKDIVIKAINDMSQINECQVVFISKASTNAVGNVISRTWNRPILTISECSGCAERGLLINFYLQEEYVRFEINDAAVKKSGLKFSSKLLKLAKIIH